MSSLAGVQRAVQSLLPLSPFAEASLYLFFVVSLSLSLLLLYLFIPLPYSLFSSLFQSLSFYLSSSFYHEERFRL